MMGTTASCQPSDLVRPFQTADTLILDAPNAHAMRERLALRLLAIQVLRGQGRDHSEACRIASHLTDDGLWTVVRGPASCGHLCSPEKLAPVVGESQLER
jgi:hypothetical protein